MQEYVDNFGLFMLFSSDLRLGLASYSLEKILFHDVQHRLELTEEEYPVLVDNGSIEGLGSRQADTAV